MGALNTVSYVFIGIGLFFSFVGAFGLHRFPDVYTRLHAATKCTTFGSLFLILAVIVQAAGIWALEGNSQSVMCIHSVVALVALLVTNATGAHAMARAAHRRISPVRPRTQTKGRSERRRLRGWPARLASLDSRFGQARPAAATLHIDAIDRREAVW